MLSYCLHNYEKDCWPNSCPADIYWHPTHLLSSSPSVQHSIRTFYSKSFFPLLTNFMNILVSLPRRPWCMTTSPKVQIPALMTMVWQLCLVVIETFQTNKPYRESMGYRQEEEEMPDSTMQTSCKDVLLSRLPFLNNVFNWSVLFYEYYTVL